MMKIGSTPDMLLTGKGSYGSYSAPIIGAPVGGPTENGGAVQPGQGLLQYRGGVVDNGDAFVRTGAEAETNIFTGTPFGIESTEGVYGTPHVGAVQPEEVPFNSDAFVAHLDTFDAASVNHPEQRTDLDGQNIYLLG